MGGEAVFYTRVCTAGGARRRGTFIPTSTFNMTSTVNPPPADLSAVVLKMLLRAHARGRV